MCTWKTFPRERVHLENLPLPGGAGHKVGRGASGDVNRLLKKRGKKDWSQRAEAAGRWCRRTTDSACRSLCPPGKC